MIVDHGRVVGNATRAVIISNRRITGLTASVIAELVAEVGPLWHERHQARLASRPRKRAVGAGAKHQLVFVDRLLAALVHLRHGTTHDVLACWFGVDRSTITRAVGEVRPLLAERGCTIDPDVRLRTLAEVIDHLGATGMTGIIDGTEIRVRRPAVGRTHRDKFISGKSKQNAVKEAAGEKGLGLAAEEAGPDGALPFGCGWDAVIAEDLPDRGDGDLDPQCCEFAEEPAISPRGIFLARRRARAQIERMVRGRPRLLATQAAAWRRLSSSRCQRKSRGRAAVEGAAVCLWAGGAEGRRGQRDHCD